MATLTNKTLNTGTITNIAFAGSGKTWAEMTKTWAEYPGPWGNPQDFTNKSIHTGSLTNKPLS